MLGNSNNFLLRTIWLFCTTLIHSGDPFIIIPSSHPICLGHYISHIGQYASPFPSFIAELERRDRSSNLEVDETGANQDDTIWTRARRFVGDDN